MAIFAAASSPFRIPISPFAGPEASSMLRRLTIDHVGPTDHLEADFGSRLNILTGDNSLGKSFLLDVVYRCVAYLWFRNRLPIPTRLNSAVPEIAFTATTGSKNLEVSMQYHRESQWWSLGWMSDHPFPTGFMPFGIGIYLRPSGDVSIWHSPAENVPITHQVPYSFFEDFDSDELLNGKVAKDQGRRLCNGLVQDWVLWQNSRTDTPNYSLYESLRTCVDGLTDPDDHVTIDEPRRVFLDDSRLFPTLSLPYGTVSFPQLSSSLKRVLTWAYALVWGWSEYVAHCELAGITPTSDIVLLIDEIETHLHPTWQRRILPALLEVVKALAPEANVQLFVTTHSPLVLASLEPLFDPDQDRLFHFEQTDHGVEFETLPWANHGDAANWLTSPVFGLSQARSVEAEKAVSDAQKFMLSDRSDATRHVEIHGRLRRLLTPEDRYWNRWVAPK